MRKKLEKNSNFNTPYLENETFATPCLWDFFFLNSLEESPLSVCTFNLGTPSLLDLPSLMVFEAAEKLYSHTFNYIYVLGVVTSLKRICENICS